MGLLGSPFRYDPSNPCEIPYYFTYVSPASIHPVDIQTDLWAHKLSLQIVTSCRGYSCKNASHLLEQYTPVQRSHLNIYRQNLSLEISSSGPEASHLFKKGLVQFKTRRAPSVDSPDHLEHPYGYALTIASLIFVGLPHIDNPQDFPFEA